MTQFKVGLQVVKKINSVANGNRTMVMQP